MFFLDKIYTVVIFERGKFCWKTRARDKNLSDYQDSDRLLILISLCVLIALIVK